MDGESEIMRNLQKKWKEESTVHEPTKMTNYLKRYEPCPHIIGLVADFIRENPGEYQISPYSFAAGLETTSVHFDQQNEKTKYVHCKDCD